MSRFRKLIEKYSSPALAEAWLDRQKKPTARQITNIFYKSARDFKAGRLSLKDFTDICGKLYFDAYLGDRKKFPSGLTVTGSDYRVRAKVIKVHKKNGGFMITRYRLPSIKPDLSSKVTRALSEFSDPSNKDEVDKYWRLKKEFHKKYLGFVRK